MFPCSIFSVHVVLCVGACSASPSASRYCIHKLWVQPVTVPFKQASALHLPHLDRLQVKRYRLGTAFAVCS